MPEEVRQSNFIRLSLLPVSSFWKTLAACFFFLENLGSQFLLFGKPWHRMWVSFAAGSLCSVCGREGTAQRKTEWPT